MKEWQEPTVEIQLFSTDDIMTVSSPDTGNQGTPWV